MPSAAANTSEAHLQLHTVDAVRSCPASARSYAAQLKARALLAVFCRDEILEARMSPEVQEIVAILARTVAAAPHRPCAHALPESSRS